MPILWAAASAATGSSPAGRPKVAASHLRTDVPPHFGGWKNATRLAACRAPSSWAGTRERRTSSRSNGRSTCSFPRLSSARSMRLSRTACIRRAAGIRRQQHSNEKVIRFRSIPMPSDLYGAKLLPQPWGGEIQEGPHLGWGQARFGMHQADRNFGQLERPQYQLELAGLDRGRHLIRQHACNADAGDRRVDAGLRGGDREPRADRDGAILAVDAVRPAVSGGHGGR